MKKYKPIAIIGYGCIFPPDSYDTKKFWENVVSGVDGIIDVSEKYWKQELYYSPDLSAMDKTYCKKGGKVEGYGFPYDKYEKYRISKENVDRLNRSQQMILDTVLQSFSMMSPASVNDKTKTVGMYLGNMLGDESFTDYIISNRVKEAESYFKNSIAFNHLTEEEKKELLREFEEDIRGKFGRHRKIDEVNILQSSLLGALKEILHVKGMGAIIDGACSGSGLVIDEAIKSLHNGDNDVCIASAVLGNMVVTGNIGFAKIGGLSKKNGSRPLDSLADGLVPGEGAGTLVLKDLSRAVEDGDTVYAVIRGSGVSSDGKGQSIYAPSSRGQLKAMKKSLERSGLQKEDIDYIETHATGTMVGDKIELNTIKEFFRGWKADEKKVALGSVKAQIGHSFSAAGMANIIKVIEGIRHKQMPPTHMFTKLPEGMSFEGTPLYINTSMKEWNTKSRNVPRRAMINAFGFGGINANVLIEEYLPSGQSVQSTKESDKETDIAIVGMGCLDFNASDVKEWYQKTEKMDFPKPSYIPSEKWSLDPEQNGKLLEFQINKIDFPFLKFKIPPAILAQIDRSQQIGLIAAGKAIGDYGEDGFKNKGTGVYVGSMLGVESAIKSDMRVRYIEYIDSLKNLKSFQKLSKTDRNTIIESVNKGFCNYLPKVEEDTLPGYMDNIIAGRISNFYDFDGANEVCDCDFLSFTAALYQAVCSLNSYENDLAVVGGIHANMSIELLKLVDDLMKRRGNEKQTIMAEGGVFFVLKRYCDVKAGDKVYARIKEIKFLEKADNQNKSRSGKIETSDGEVFYLGANEGFRLMNNIRINNQISHDYLFEQTGASLFGNSMSVTVCGKDYVEKKETDAPLRTAYFAANSFDKIFENCYTDTDLFNHEFQYKVAIVYRSEDELSRKIEKCKKLL